MGWGGAARSDAVEGVAGQFIFLIAGVEYGGGFEEDDLYFFPCCGPVLDAFWDDDEFAGGDGDGLIAELHVETAGDHQEHFVFIIMFVPDEIAFEFDEFDVLIIQFGGYSWIPVIRDQAELVGDVYFLDGHDLKLRIYFNMPERGRSLNAGEREIAEGAIAEKRGNAELGLTLKHCATLFL